MIDDYTPDIRAILKLFEEMGSTEEEILEEAIRLITEDEYLKLWLDIINV